MDKCLVNILIVFNKNDMNCNQLLSKQCNQLFDSMKTSIHEIIGRNKYTIYSMSSDELQSTNSWHLSTAFVISIGDQLKDQLVDSQMSAFYGFNGTHIKFALNDLLINEKNNPNVNYNEIAFNSQYFKQQMSTYFDNNLDKSLDKLHFEDMKESNVYLITKDRNDLHFIESNKQYLDSKIRIRDEKSMDSQNCILNETINDSKMDLIINANLNDISFDAKTYFSNLKTTKMGQSIAFANITNSTMTLMESFKGMDGFVAIANQQTKGRGRHRNEWLSPKGCAMFTVQLSLSLNSNIGQRLSFVQHLAAISIITAINTIPGYEDLDIGVKWPNDILYNKTKSKLSGILVTSVLNGNHVNVMIGCGINVYNREPSLCLNDVIDNYNNESLTNKLVYVKPEEVIARTLTQLESLLSTFEQTNGIQIIKQLYTKHWTHSRESIKLINNKVEKIVTIEGLDNDGYLEVRERSSGALLSLHPDGNRFDMLHNLIISNA